MKCCPPASRNFLTRRALGYPKRSFVAKCLSSVHNLCKLDGSIQYTLSHFRRGRVLPRGVCHHVIVGFLLVFFLIPAYSPIWFMAECGQWHFDKDDQLSTTKGVDMNMHHGTNSSLLLVISWTATVFEASFWQIWAQGFLRWPLYQTPFVVAMAALLVAGKPSVAATSMETLTKTNTLAKHARQQFQVLKCMRSWISQKCTKGKL